MKKIVRRIAAGALCAGLMISCAGCQMDPEGSLVKHKDMEKLISQAAGSQPGTVGARDLQADVAENFDSYKAQVSDESLHVQLTADAQVDVPEVDKLSIYRVKQKKIDQELVDKVIDEFMGGETLYDGRAVTQRVRSDVEADIEYLRQQMKDTEAQLREEGVLTEEEIQENVNAYQFEMDLLQEEYESAPENVDLSAYPGDSSLEAMYDWDGQGDVKALSLINDGAGGLYKSLTVQDSDNYSNKLVYRSSPAAYVRSDGCLVAKTYLSEDGRPTSVATASSYDTYWKDKGLAEIVVNNYQVDDSTQFAPVPGWTCQLTQEEAQDKARALLDKLGFSEFTLGRGELCSETLSLKNLGPQEPGEAIPFATYYILQYYREIDGVQLTQTSGVKYQDGWDGDGNFKKEMWPAECVELRVNDSGVVGFSVLAPVEVTETVVEGAGLIPFEEVKGTFESMAAVARAREYEQVVGEVREVNLSYSRISEKDRFDTGLIVPVWSFEGKEEYYMEERLGGNWEGTILAINAVDGSVIDETLGY